MVKKIYFFIIIYLLFINMASCSKDKIIYKLDKNILIINNEIKINLNDNIENVLKILGNQFTSSDMPGYKGYYLMSYPLIFFVNIKTKKIDSLALKFYDFHNNYNVKLIDELNISDIIIKKDTSFEKIKELFAIKKIKYDLEDNTNFYEFKIKNHRILSIDYMSDDLTGPSDIQINVD